MSFKVADLPGLAMRKAADLYPGTATTDAHDAFIIADTARTMPHTLRAVDHDSEVLSALKVVAGFDEDLAHKTTRAINRLRSLLVQIYPSLERVFAGKTITRPIVLDPLVRYHGPQGLQEAGKSAVKRWARNHTRKDPSGLVDAIFAALDAQTAAVPGSEAVELVIPRVAGQIVELNPQRKILSKEIEAMVDDFSSFPTPGHLAAYAGSTPVTRRSGTSIRGDHPARSGNKRLKNALFHSAFVASCHVPESRTCYQRKIAEKKHNAAIMCLARRRLNVLHAMVENGTLYQPKPDQPTPGAA